MSDDEATPADPQDTGPKAPSDSPSPTTDTQTKDTQTKDTPTKDTPAKGAPDKDPLRGSRTSGIWAGVVALGVVLVLLIIFIAQNTQPVSVTFLSWTGSTPLAVAMLIATTTGLFLTAAAGSLRILQLRRRVRHDRKR